jgi:hypothetical protein
VIFLFLATLYSGEERAARVQLLLDVVERTPPELLARAYQHVATAERGACAAGTRRIRVECVIAAARKFCETQDSLQDCLVYQDVIVSNVLAEPHWVPATRRYEIMKQAKDWRREVAREIRRHQGVLAADLRLRTKGSLATTRELGRAIDDYCASSAFETGLSWQICAASLVWFIAVKEAK